MLEKFVHIDPNQPASLQDQIKTAIVQAIMNGFVNKDDPVTSSRKLAMSLKVSRNTVMRVYELLNEEGFFISIERKGYFVNPELVLHETKDSQLTTSELDWERYLKINVKYQQTPQLDIKSYPYRFVHGMVDESIFPINEWRKCSIQSSNKLNSKQWTSSNNDYDELIEQIRTRVLPRRGIFVQADEIMVTLGSQQSLHLISRLLTSSNTKVGIENPGYPEAHTQLSAKQSQIIPLEVDGEGVIVDQNIHQCDLVYTTPTSQFPTTVRMSSERRRSLIDASEVHDFLIIEDDFDHEVNFFDENVPALKAEHTTERIIYLASFSSTIAPGLRLGFIVGAKSFIQQAKQLQRQNHSYPPPNNCQTLAIFLKLGYYDSLIQKLLKSLRSKWLTMEKALNYYFPQSGVVPSLSGTAFWINYTQGFDANKLARLSELQGILINPGEQYYFIEPCNNGFRLSFNSIDESNIREGIRQLSLLAKSILPLEKIQDSEGKQLSGQQIREVLNRHTLLTSDCFNIPYRVTFQVDGRMHGMSDRPNDEDEGYWWVEGDKMCFQWKNWQFADTRQLRLVRNGSVLKRYDAEGYCVSIGELESY